MSRTISRRLLAQSPLTPFPQLITVSKALSQYLRSLSNTSRRAAEGDNSRPPPPPPAPPRSQPANPPVATSQMSALLTRMENDRRKQISTSRGSTRRTGFMDTNFDSDTGGEGYLMKKREDSYKGPHQMHVYATRHNCHITIVRPPGWKNPAKNNTISKDRTVAISLGCGNLGFRHSGRKHYDSAFQLASYVMGRMQESGLNAEIQEIELFLRGFGAGREAVTKALLGTEGKYLRNKVIKVSDATRLKFGGTRSKKPRRLG